jgi:hypothetical protein
MKLYTREQMIEAFNYGQTLKGFDWIGDMIDSLEAIELPTDEEVEKYLKTFPYTKHLDDGQYNDGVIVGAELAIEWMKEQINNKINKI